MGIPLKAGIKALSDCQPLQFLLGHVPEGRVTKIVCKSRRFDDVWIDSPERRNGRCVMLLDQLLSKAPRNLSDFECVSKPVVEDVPFVCRYDLRYTRETSKGRAIQDSVPITLAARSIVGGLVTIVEPIFPSRHGERSLLSLAERRLRYFPIGNFELLVPSETELAAVEQIPNRFTERYIVLSYKAGQVVK